MFFTWNFSRKEKIFLNIFFLAGFLGGIAAICLFSEQLVIETGFLNAAFLNRLKSLEVNRAGLFLYSLRTRLGAAGFLFLISAAGLAAVGVAGILLWAGLSIGAVLTALSMRYGFKGLILFIFSILPQQIMFVPAYLLLIDVCLKRREHRKLLFSLIVVITGCFMESYVNPMIIKVVLKIF